MQRYCVQHANLLANILTLSRGAFEVTASNTPCLLPLLIRIDHNQVIVFVKNGYRKRPSTCTHAAHLHSNVTRGFDTI